MSGVRLTAKHFGQFAATAPKQPDLGCAVGIQIKHPIGKFVQVARHFIRQRIVEPTLTQKPPSRFLQHAGLGQHFEHAAEDPLVIRNDIQPLSQFIGVHDIACLAFPAELVQRYQRAGTRPSLQVVQQGAPVCRCHSFLGQIVGEQARAGRDSRGRGQKSAGLIPGASALSRHTTS